ncbi:low molecular weight protein arginine phosphatase [Clostridium thermobutyricum]|uniref:Low molecular weight protein-tyrosine-phosphatase YwlE n=1 Tax=Clostridium thermobutyricum DSM 4928 TaxID=1121339 RepID=A0A1V4SY07_9CLOT|nr:low molecular weight protein arginine phosphatase [Clostridium thermobutyricum]OPX49039.1 Low molecular weight protein-tyrosine-phosphatase YwlE [Clostridium thermobutyricum DSM 4928]
MNILFVCTVNTCRSVMAEAIFNKIESENLIIAKSAGISIIRGSVVTENAAMEILNDLHIDIRGREAISINEDKLRDSDLVLTMTNYSKEFIKENFPKYKEKIFSICEYAGVSGEILDPYGSSVSVYEKIYRKLKGLMPIVLDKIKEEGRA